VSFPVLRDSWTSGLSSDVVYASIEYTLRSSLASLQGGGKPCPIGVKLRKRERRAQVKGLETEILL